VKLERGIGALVRLVQGALRHVSDLRLRLGEQKRPGSEDGVRGGDRLLRLTEPDYGSNPPDDPVARRRKRLGVNGAKMWITTLDRAVGHRVGQDRKGRRREIDSAASSSDEHPGLLAKDQEG